MSIKVKLPDGSQVTVNTTDTTAAAAAARRHWDQKQATTPRTGYKGFIQTAADFVDDTVDNMLPNWGDELRGAGRAARAVVSGRDPRAAFREGQRSFRADQRRYDARHPNLSWVSTGAGQVAGLALPAGKALRGASLGQKVRQSAAVGGAYGAVAGAGEGSGLDLSRRTANAATGALAGAATGAVLPVAIDRTHAVGRFARETIPGVDKAVSKLGRIPQAVLARAFPNAAQRAAPQRPSAVTQRADRRIVESMNDGHLDAGPGLPGAASTPQAIAQEVERRNQMGAPAMVGDVSPSMRGLTASASRGIGPGQTMVRERLEARKALEGQRVEAAIRANFPTVPDPVAYLDGARRESKAAAGPLYREAYGQPVYRSPDMQAIEQTPAFQDALPQAYRNIRNQIDETTGLPKDPLAMGFRHFDGSPDSLPPTGPYFAHPSGGYVGIGEGLSTEGYDQAIRAMRDGGISAANRNPVTGRVEDTTNSVHINQLAGRLRDNLAEQNAPYAQAVKQYGDDMSVTNAFRQGQDISKLSGPEIEAQRRTIPEFAQAPWSTGAGTAMADEASRYSARHPYGDTANRVQAMLGDDTKQASIGEMTGNTGSVRNLQDLLEMERQATLNWRGARGGQGSSGTGEDMGIPTTAGGLVQRFVGHLAGLAKGTNREEFNQRIAEVVTSRNPQTVVDVIQAVTERADADRSFRDMLHQSGLMATMAYGRNLEGQFAAPEGDNGY